VKCKAIALFVSFVVQHTVVYELCDSKELLYQRGLWLVHYIVVKVAWRLEHIIYVNIFKLMTAVCFFVLNDVVLDSYYLHSVSVQ